jgi:uncharacterized protein YneF (UPF0154 family)
MDDDSDTSARSEAPEPPPFQTDPELIAYLEHGGKPSEAKVREMAERVRALSARED